MARQKEILRLGGGSACPGERLEPAIELIEKGKLDYIIFDSLSESELLAFEKQKMHDHSKGYDAYMEDRLKAILPICAHHQVKIIGNMGGANAESAQELALKIARELGLSGMRIAAVLGDDVFHTIKELDPKAIETDTAVSTFRENLISARAYIPADPIVEALENGAGLVITGRVGDASLFLAPMRYEFGWNDGDWDLLAKGIVTGHLLECAGQVTGGYFADPPYKLVPGLYRLGFPIVEVEPNGGVVITKPPGSGGVVNTATCTEQLLYETDDPANYIEADVIVDFQEIEFEQIGPDRVKVAGTIKGKPKPQLLKVNLGVKEGYFAEGTIFYGGPGAFERAKLAAEIMGERLERVVNFKGEVRFDFLGVNALSGHGETVAQDLWEVGLRVAGRARERDEANKINREIETIDNNGPASIARSLRKEELREILGYYSTRIPREKVETEVVIREA
jgi:Acyclic terpene utilisation family protein AtuA